MRHARVLFREEPAGMLTQQPDGSFTFRYLDAWMASSDKPDISLTLPKSKQEHSSKHLFPFFFNLLPEGANKQVVCRSMRIDEKDHFGLLMTIAQFDTIGAVRVVPDNMSE